MITCIVSCYQGKPLVKMTFDKWVTVHYLRLEKRTILGYSVN